MIESLHSPHIARVKALIGSKGARERHEQGLFVAEGIQCAREALSTSHGPQIKTLYATAQGLAKLEDCDLSQIDLIEVSGGTYEAPAMTGATASPKKESTIKREAYFMDFTDKVRKVSKVPLMLTGGFRSLNGMRDALNSGGVDLIGLARSVAIEPDLPQRLLGGSEALYPVKPLTTGLKAVDSSGLLEIQWYTRQIKRMAKGKNPVPNEHPILVLIAYLFESGWGLFRARKLRA